MPRKSISFELDFMTKDILPRFTVKQFDDVSFNIKPKKQGLDYDTTGMTGKIFIGVNNDMFMQTKNITVSNNNVNILLDRNMLQKNGRAYAEVELTDSNGTITSSSFIFNIDEKIGEGAKIPGEYEGFVAKYERLISEFKSQVNETISNCNANVDNKLNTVDSLINVKISDFEKRFNRLTSSQQQDAEVIDARTDFKGVVFDSLKERIDYTDKILRESTVSTVTTESDFTTVEATSNGYFEDVKLEGKTLVNKFIFSHTETVTDSRHTIIAKDYRNITNIKVTIVNLSTKPIWVGTYNSSSDAFVKAHKIEANSSLLLDLIGIYLYNIIGYIADGWTSADELKPYALWVEGDHTQNPPSYFEGLKSVGQDVDEIVVSSVKGDGNLFDVKDFYRDGWQCNEPIVNSDGSFTLTPSAVGGVAYVRSKPFELEVGETYKLDVEVLNSTTPSDDTYYVWVHDTTNVAYANLTQPFTATEYGKIVDLAFYVYNATTLNSSTTYKVNLYKYKNEDKPYTPHKADKKRLLYYNNETQTWEKPILREWDSIEKHSDGKYYYHQRSGEVVLNGSESWDLIRQDTNTSLFSMTKLSNMKYVDENTIYLISDKFTGVIGGNWYLDSEIMYLNSQHLQLRINKTKLSTQDVTGFNQWLQTNNVTVVYQLAQEKVYECTNIDLITYANETNYIVESGAITPRTTLKVHNNISNVVSLLQKKVSLLESNMTKYMITQNRMQLASTYSADSVTFKVDYALCSEEVEYNEDLYNLILNNILVGKDNYNYDKMFNMILDYASWNQISWEQFDILVGLMDIQHNPPIEEIPTDDEVIEEIPNEIM